MVTLVIHSIATTLLYSKLFLYNFEKLGRLSSFNNWHDCIRYFPTIYRLSALPLTSHLRSRQIILMFSNMTVDRLELYCTGAKQHFQTLAIVPTCKNCLEAFTFVQAATCQWEIQTYFSMMNRPQIQASPHIYTHTSF